MVKNCERLPLLLMLIGLFVLLTSGGVSAQVLRRGIADPQSLDPHKAGFLFEHLVEHDLYEGLVIFTPSGGVTGAAAGNWEISQDGIHYTFRLRPGLRWSNGEALTARDFVYSFRRLVNPATKSPSAFLAYPIQNAEEIAGGKNSDVKQLGVEAVGSDVLRITLKTPTPYFLASLTNACFLPVNEKNVVQYGDNFTKPGNLVSNGAYVLQDWVLHSRVVLKRNSHYRDLRHVKIAEVQYLSMPNVSEEFRRYLAGEVDITWDVPAAEIPGLLAGRRSELRIFPYFGVYYYQADLKSPPFRDRPGLRQALAMSIDREQITREILGGGELPAYTWVPPGLSGYNSQSVGWKNLSREQRLAQARRLYKDAGYGPENPLKVEIDYHASEVRRKIAEAIARQWKDALGADVILAVTKAPETSDDKTRGRLESAGWNADYADPNTFLEIWKSDSTGNATGYSSQEYDALLDRAAHESDASARFRLLEQAEQVLLKDMPMVPIYDFVLKKLVNPKVIGYSPNILGYAYSKDISFASTVSPGHK